ncbi:putative aryl-alcohol dehydrogenase aad14 [Friedmanniomyces endolithicus]|uniref:Aldo-keto reductase ausK n=1 Tax=Friedmanniomyces endolithicus TaxID=329885 RepID=A0AAN6H598_9PEZI|nr:putative aryl-alcohol dehydrogenase aad14 [Friedmanniomyces endolithicus]KAK0777710.1 putative aryl-alcohol dehydrogenase aad14 [Friedmanniomyces endolithicus]KAK0790357.1 putative aryl-alcohol dehydrogenase aad14 [Friedmanniomyces endolithicus]KAK0817307.1 putative aryl-alcohol dehydrogenase aad14 [Friedmanniomyces endolithicus]KAK0866395.1 putative aryl-alcohol dehydrogenase aad14 [Friedmanniomyces endolithicus]
MGDLFAPAPEPKTELGRFRVLSSTAGIRVSALQLGAMSIGDAWSGFMGSMSKEQSFKLMDAYFDAGGNFIDTANNYQNEQSETWIGEWMEKRGNRDYMVIATKFTTPYTQYKDGKGKNVNFSGNHKRSLKLSLRDSLKKLQTDFIDILYVHWWDWTTSVEELMDSLDEVVKQGKVLYLGISDTPAYIVSACNMYARAHGKTPFSIYQGRWNVILRDMEREIIPMCRHFGMAIAPWDAIGGGKFQTKAAIEERKKNNEGLRSMMGSGDQTSNEEKVSAALEEVAKEHGVKSVTAVALAYVMSKSPNVFPIVGGRKVEHLMDNIESLKIKLTDAQIEKLEAVVPFEPGFPNNFVGEDPHVTGKSGSFLMASAAPMAYVKSSKPIGHE